MQDLRKRIPGTAVPTTRFFARLGRRVSWCAVAQRQFPIAETATYNAAAHNNERGITLPSPAINANWLRLQQQWLRWLAPLWQRAAALGVERWRNILIAMLAAWIIANLARLIWLMLPLASASTNAVPVDVGVVNAPSPTPVVDVEKMVGWHLFGEVGAQPRVAVVEEQAQETTLNLQLLGIIASSEPTQARAFIQADGKQQQFAIGEQLPGGGRVVLSKVLVDRAIIDNNGRHETLWLYDPNASNQSSSSAPVTSMPSSDVDLRDDAQVTNAAVGYRQQLYQNPTGLADVIQVAPAMDNGKLAGYRVNPGRDPAQFAKFGLKPGDVITSVNGISLQNPQSALELYNVLRSAREASITVQRGGESTQLHVSLDQEASDDGGPVD